LSRAEGQFPANGGSHLDVARHFGIYTGGAIVSLVCSVALLPVYATQFTADQFGIVATGQVVALGITTAARLGIGIGMFRFLVVYYSRQDSEAADSVVTTCLAASIAVALAVTLITLAGWRLFDNRMAADVQLIGIFIAVNISLAAPREIAEFALRAKRRAGSYVLLTSSFIVMSTVLTAGLVLLLHGGVPAVFASLAIANGITAPIAIYILRGNLKTKLLSASELKRALRFGIPSVPALLADWVTQYSDRFFLTRFSGLTQVGIYSMGYRIGLIEQQVLGTASQAAWDPFVLSTYSDGEGARRIGRAATYFATAGMALVVLLSASATSIFTIFHARHEYFAAAPVVFLIALANFFALLQYLFLAPTSIRLRPEFGTLLRLLAAAVNIALNFLLIPTFGMLGAAWATVVTFLMSALVTEAVGRRLWRIAYEYRKLALIVIGGLVTQGCIQFADQATIALPLGLEPIFAEVVFVVWLLLTRVVSRSELLQIAQVIRYSSSRRPPC
jgi:O-antigen/teichoic acid export membrane protein